MAVDLGKRALVGSLATAGGNLLAFLLRFGVNAVLARLIAPGSFGTYGFAATYAGLLSILQSFSFAQALVQLGDKPGLWATSRRLAVLLGLAGVILALVIAPIIAHAQSREVAECFVGLAIVQALTGFSYCYEAMLTRHFRFTAVAILRIVSVAVGLVVALPLATIEPGPFVLVLRDTVPPLFSLAVVAWIVRRDRLTSAPGIAGPYDKATARDVWRLGRSLFLSRAFEAAFQQIDSLVVGALLGKEALGHYQQAKYIAGLPGAAVSPFGMSVGLRTFTAVKDEPARLARVFGLTQWAIARFVAVFMIGTLVAPDLAIRLVLGPGWEQAAAFLLALTPWLAFMPLAINQQILLTATGTWRPIRVAFIVGAAVMAALAWPLEAWAGPAGVAWAASAGYAAISVVLLTSIAHHFVLPARALWVPAAAVLVGAAVGRACRPWLLDAMYPPVGAGLAVFIGLVGFGVATLVLEGRALKSELRYLRDVIRRRS